ncbi:hypothetical protein [Rubripirellula obstinata]|nr:hypothetical protein [Rubripirellula obstinata]
MLDWSRYASSHFRGHLRPAMFVCGTLGIEAGRERITMACTGAGLARFHKWNINRPGPVMPDVIPLGARSFHFNAERSIACFPTHRDLLRRIACLVTPSMIVLVAR